VSKCVIKHCSKVYQAKKAKNPIGITTSGTFYNVILRPTYFKMLVMISQSYIAVGRDACLCPSLARSLSQCCLCITPSLCMTVKPLLVLVLLFYKWLICMLKVLCVAFSVIGKLIVMIIMSVFVKFAAGKCTFPKNCVASCCKEDPRILGKVPSSTWLKRINIFSFHSFIQLCVFPCDKLWAAFVPFVQKKQWRWFFFCCIIITQFSTFPS